MEALQALQTTLYAYLAGDGSRLWGNRVKPSEIAASGVEYPYISYFYVSGGREEMAAWLRSARITLTIKGVCGHDDAVSDPLTIAMEMQGLIADLLVDTGEQDFQPLFPTHAGWRFLTINQGRIVYQAIQLSDTRWSYHAGHQYEFLMEKK
jgi:hypothetical protein